MSVAFVKEPNEDQVEVLPDRDLGTDPNLVTARGLALLDRELAALGQAKETARAAGDKVAAATIERDLRYVRARRASAQLVEPEAAATGVRFGDAVTIWRDDGRTQTFRIVGIDEADPPNGFLSYLSPLARNLVGRAVGDAVRAGATEAEIVEIGNAPA